MKEKQHDGGPAFPWRWMDRDSTGQEVTRDQGEGMSLWHFFASAAFQALATQHGWTQPPHVIASRAGEFADEMLKEAQRRFRAS